MTIPELVERFGISKSTAYGWTKGIPVPESILERRSQHAQTIMAAGSAAMQEKYQLLREEAYALGESQIDELFATPTFSDFITLYLAEGSKREQGGRLDLQHRRGDYAVCQWVVPPTWCCP